MSQKKLIIFEYSLLFNILNEISEVLNFDLIQADKNNINDIQKKFKSDFLIISKEKNSINSNHLVLENLPLKIYKIIEIMNVEFLKKKFNLQSDLTIGSYNLNLNSRQISKKSIKLNLTEREGNLIIFLNKSTSPVSVDTLQKEVWEYGSELETHTVETHIYRLRKKIKERFNDNNFIISSKEGYIIN
tara:strand:+ start:459 stop:1022 length:564 start_codon:yes stop_codon:yes gene_type:complete